ncbi:Elongation of fatty acids protein 2 [Podila epigama]|nr:Elongation of fatty acids protein 2 [Podila epigama]
MFDGPWLAPYATKVETLPWTNFAAPHDDPDQLIRVMTASQDFISSLPEFLPIPLHPLQIQTSLSLSDVFHSSDETRLFQDLDIKDYLDQISKPRSSSITYANDPRDRAIQKYVHEALDSFVRLIENIDQDPEEVYQISNRKQRELNVLESQLVQEIKDILPPPAIAHRDTQGLDPTNSVTDKVTLKAGGSEENIPAQLASAWVQTVDTNAQQPQQRDSNLDPILPHASEEEEESSKDISESLHRSSEQNDPASDEQWKMHESIEMASIDPLPASSPGQSLVQSPLSSPIPKELPELLHTVLATHKSILSTLERRTMRVTRSLVESCQDLLRALGMPIVVAEGAEAEAVCAQLTTLGISHATISEDTDTAVFGNGLLLRQVGASNKDVLEINPVVAHSALGLTRDAFRDMCILCGTDFSGTIEGIGPIRAARLIQYYGSIESILANTNYAANPTFLYDHARRVFDRAPTLPQDKAVSEPNAVDEEALVEWLLRYDIRPEETQKDLQNE